MSTESVSIIVPCYNSERYLRDCLNSILEQEYAYKEIICVDDGSTDMTRQILDEYTEKNSILKVVEQPHGGIVEAKKTGIKEAQGEYVLFVDSDDMLEKGMLSKCVDIFDDFQVDAIYYGYHLIKGNVLSTCVPTFQAGVYDKKNICENLYDIQKSKKNFNWAQWAYILKRRNIEEYMDKIDKGIEIYEDIVFTWMYLINLNCIYILDEALYYYRVHSDSTGRRRNQTGLQSANLAYNNLVREIGGHPFENQLGKQLKYMMFDTIQSNTCFSEERQEFFMFPYEVIPYGANIILYGAGYVGKSYYRQLRENKYCKLVLWCDRNWNSIRSEKYPVESIDKIENTEFEYILICNMHKQVAEDIKQDLVKRYTDVDQDKIIVYEPRKLSRFVDLD